MNDSYKKLFTYWEIVRDCYEGVESIKSSDRARVYLPPQPAERAELEKGRLDSRYEFRKQVATYQNFFKSTIDDIVGVMSRNKMKMQFGVQSDDESPKEILDMRAKGNRYSDGLAGLKARINHAQTLYGRYGLLLDVVTDDQGLNPEFCISEYPAFAILDGDYFESTYDNRKKLHWALLDESAQKFDLRKKEWTTCERRRLLALDAQGRYYNAAWEGSDVEKIWRAFDVDYPQESPDVSVVYPSYKGNLLNFVPLTVCNTDRLGLDHWDAPPYLDVAQIAVGNYVVDSWYKMGLYQFSTPTLVIANAKGDGKDIRLGGVLWLNSGANAQAASASILETSGSALAELRYAKQELKEALKHCSVRELLGDAGANASGDALRLRAASGTAAIATADKTSARALEEQVEFACVWHGMSRDEAAEKITFEADTSYLGQEFQLGSVVAFIQANAQNKVLSRQNTYAVLEKTFPDLISDYDDNEAQLIGEGADTLGAQLVQVGNLDVTLDYPIR